MSSGLFGFWLRFGSVTGFSNLLLRRSLAKKPKIPAAHRYIFSVDALVICFCIFRNLPPHCGCSIHNWRNFEHGNEAVNQFNKPPRAIGLRRVARIAPGVLTKL